VFGARRAALAARAGAAAAPDITGIACSGATKRAPARDWQRYM
jgi:hypothetical protein